jgi:hypothetical protein
MPIEGQPIAMRTQRCAVGIVTAFQTGQGVLIAGRMALVNQTQGMQVVVDETQDVIIAFTRIARHFTDVEKGKAAAQVLEAGDGLQVVVAIGGDERSRQDPIGEQPIIQDAEGFGLVAKVMFAAAVGRG